MTKLARIATAITHRTVAWSLVQLTISAFVTSILSAFATSVRSALNFLAARVLPKLLNLAAVEQPGTFENL